ncbi:MAG: SpoIID/LytB domain-containing protein [Candidatus Omnitrophica bacterium]|nr:SpoIID/LytB domain-containing protein [Candidatus Omnitrophota bacterium]
MKTIFNKKIIFFIIPAMIIFAYASAINGISVVSADKLSREAAVAYNNGRTAQALKIYNRIAKSNNLQGYLNMAVIYKDIGDYRRAINILKKATAEYGKDANILLLLARLYYLNAQIDNAIDTAKEVLEMAPDCQEAVILSGLCFDEKKDAKTAEYFYQKAISVDKDNVLARFSLADLYYRSEKIEEALVEYRQLGIIDSSIIKIQRVLAKILYRLKNFEEALKAYRKISLLYPNDDSLKARVSEIEAILGKDYLEKEKEALATRRKEKKILVKPAARTEGMPLVRIGILEDEDRVEFKCSVPFQIVGKPGGENTMQGIAEKIYVISRFADNRILILSDNKEEAVFEGAVLISPQRPEGTVTLFNVVFGKDNFWSAKADYSYRGSLEISRGLSGITVINIVNMEEYLYGVLPSEMPHTWPKEALKAQAIAARSEAIKKLGRHKDKGFDFCPHVHCQTYAGVEKETPTTNEAVDETRGVIMEYKGQVIDALYSSNCGGHTQDNIFGNAQDIPYLKGKRDSPENTGPQFPLSPIELEQWLKSPPKDLFCANNNSSFRWVRVYSAQELEEMLKKLFDFGKIKRMIVTRRNKSGHVEAIKIVGANSSYTLEKELRIRNALGALRSSMFKVEVKYGPGGNPEQFIFYGGGWGHAVGMCQTGAAGMARLGKNHREILSYYFQGIDFKKIY